MTQGWIRLPLLRLDWKAVVYYDPSDNFAWWFWVVNPLELL